MQELSINTTPAKISTNFEEVEQALQEHLQKFDTVVTADGVKDAKATATSINKLRQQIASRRKAAVEEVSAPIRAFEEQMKSLEKKCEETRRSILDQVQKYEDETREQARDLLVKLRAQLWDDHLIDDEHRRADIEDLVKLTSVTATGNLTKSACDTVESRVREDESRQQKVKMRLLELENRSYRAGLSAPLTRDHVSQWLEADEETYERELDRILKAEIGRQEEAERRMRERMAKEERAKQETPEPERKEPETAPQSDGQPDPVEPQQPSTPGRIGVTVQCTFQTEIPPHVTDDQIEAELRKKLADAGIKSLTGVSVRRQEAA